MSSLLLMAHPGNHPHPHGPDWLSITDNPLLALAVAVMLLIVIGLARHGMTHRD